MMIVEYCKYGNLSNYLRSKRADFIVYKVNQQLSEILLSHQIKSLHDLVYLAVKTFMIQYISQPNRKTPDCQKNRFLK